jgi:hypothetical protein
MPALRYKADWDQWTSQFAPTLAGFGWLCHFVEQGYADLPALPTGSSDPDRVIWEQSNKNRAFLRESVAFSYPGQTGLYTLSPGACRVLHANPPPSVPTFDWERDTLQTDLWAANKARGRVDRNSFELRAASEVFLFPWELRLPSPRACARP